MSDKAFGGRRAPAGLAFFLFLAAALAALGRTLDAAHAIVWLGLAAGAAFGLHALLCGAAAMDAGGARAAGSVSGLLDSAHHAAGGLAVLLVGSLVDRGGWGAWTKGLIPFALLGAAACAAAVRLRAEARNPSL
ncbi:MAG: hypothetical protein M0D55_12090 [Elusimicrobiota bacterium]|nr:MAG: hypothetical protein M0D55_12090 [Elusimicrobiota bacterium]